MPDVLTKAQRSRCMAAIRGHGNKETELKLLGILRRHRITGWRRRAALQGKPDFVFPKARVAVFVDGCFWHACPKHCRYPASNRRYWRDKLGRNQARDRTVNAVLRAAGWKVVRIWEHALRAERPLVRRLQRALEPR